MDDQLDIRFHKGPKPEVYYRCPTLSSLDGALGNEILKNSQSLIPTEIISEFVFGAESTITIHTSQQPNLSALGIQASNVPQSTTVENTLCRYLNGKERLKAQRAVARCFVETISTIDGFKYMERQARNKEEGDGVRFKYVCVDSLQNRTRLGKSKRKMGEEAERRQEEEDFADPRTLSETFSKPSFFDCGGAIHIKFSLKRDAINVVYKHNQLHARRTAMEEPHDRGYAFRGPLQRAGTVVVACPYGCEHRNALMPSSQPLTLDAAFARNDNFPEDSSMIGAGAKTEPKKKRKRRSKAELVAAGATEEAPYTCAPAAPFSSATSRTKKGKKNAGSPSSQVPRSSTETNQQPASHAVSRLKKQTTTIAKRSKTGCFNCRARKRKCNEERSICAYCSKVNDDCEYG